MRFKEFQSDFSKYLATVRVNGLVVKFTLEVANQSQARALLVHLFGQNNLLGLVTVSISEEVAGTRVLSADELKVQNLAQQRERYAKAEKQEKARQSLVKAQQRMRDAQNL